MKILKNTTASDISLDIGINLIANNSREISVQDYIQLSSDTSLTQLDVLIDLGSVVVNDGTNDLTKEEGKAYIRFPDNAKGIRYNNTNSDIDETNVQDAIDNIINNNLNLTYGTLDKDIHIPNNLALVLVNPKIGDNEIIIEGELVCL